MKLNRLFALSLAAVMLCTGCSNDAKPVDTNSAYDTLTQELRKWDGSENMSTFVSGNIFTEYNDVPGAVSFEGQYMQQAISIGNKVMATLNFSYGDGYYFSNRFLSDGKEFAVSIETGSTSATTTESSEPGGEYVDADTFNSSVSFGIPQLAFDTTTVSSTSIEKATESDNLIVSFQLNPSKCETPVITLLEQLQYIDTNSVPVTAEVSSMSCDATYNGSKLETLTYKFSADLTAEGEVMETNLVLSYDLLDSGSSYTFEMPRISTVINA